MSTCLLIPQRLQAQPGFSSESRGASAGLGDTGLHLCTCTCVCVHKQVCLRAECPLAVCPRHAGVLRRSKHIMGGWGRMGVLQGLETLSQQPGPHPTQPASLELGDKVGPQKLGIPASSLPAAAPCHALLRPHSPTYMTPSLVFSAASVTPCLVFSTAPTTPSLAMEKPFLKTSMVVGRAGRSILAESCGWGWRECCCSRRVRRLLLTPMKY